MVSILLGKDFNVFKFIAAGRILSLQTEPCGDWQPRPWVNEMGGAAISYAL